MEKIKNPSNLDNIQIPPGFRFHPTDEELIVHYLHKKVTQTTLPASIFAEIELYKFDPWELPYKALFGEDEWYFFSPRDRKYPNGVKPNRMAGSGYWKATGTDTTIMGSYGGKMVGVKKGLVFYKGRPSRGVKTNWIMHEYRLLDTVTCNSSKPKESMRLDDDWVLCRVKQKTCSPRNVCEDYGGRIREPEKSTETNPNFEIMKERLFKDCPMLPFMFGPQLDFSYMNNMEKGGNFEASLVGYESNKKLRTMEGQNCQSEKVWSLGIDANDMSLFGGEQGYMM